jgi:hypothetical protein
MKSAIDTENAEFLPGYAVWISVLVMILLSLSTGYLFWAKIASAWPFSP